MAMNAQDLGEVIERELGPTVRRYGSNRMDSFRFDRFDLYHIKDTDEYFTLVFMYSVVDVPGGEHLRVEKRVPATMGIEFSKVMEEVKAFIVAGSWVKQHNVNKVAKVEAGLHPKKVRKM